MRQYGSQEGPGNICRPITTTMAQHMGEPRESVSASLEALTLAMEMLGRKRKPRSIVGGSAHTSPPRSRKRSVWERKRTVTLNGPSAAAGQEQTVCREAVCLQVLQNRQCTRRNCFYPNSTCPIFVQRRNDLTGKPAVFRLSASDHHVRASPAGSTKLPQGDAPQGPSCSIWLTSSGSRRVTSPLR